MLPFSPKAADNVSFESAAVCYTNTSASDYFLPNKTHGEWTSFYNKVLAVGVPGVAVKTPCCLDGSCNSAGGETCANCGDCLSACSAYHLDYFTGLNGTLTGSTSQAVALNGSGTAVTVVPNYGYAFNMWSDGSTANPRTDTNVTVSHAVTASFLPDPCGWNLCAVDCTQNCNTGYTVPPPTACDTTCATACTTTNTVPAACTTDCPQTCVNYNWAIPNTDYCYSFPCNCGLCSVDCAWNCPGGYWGQ
ncbi:MAG: hypothetical protein WC467_03540 [Patescibacteria group bacterium]